MHTSLVNMRVRKEGGFNRDHRINRAGISAVVTGMVMMLHTVAGAAAPTLLSEQDYLADIPLVLSATRLEQPLNEIPAAMTVIDRQMIEASGARNVIDLFRLVPGMQVGYWTGNKQITSMHGFGDVYARRMQVLVDGRSIYTPAYGGVPWGDMPLVLDDIERIEVIRGPNAASYGANSFLGIISIITKDASADHGVHAKINNGTQAIRDGSLRFGSNAGNLDYRVSLGYQQDSGFARRYDDSKDRMITVSADYRLGSADVIESRFGYSGGMNQKGEFGEFLGGPRDQKNISRFEQLRWQHDMGQGEGLSVQVYHNFQESDEQYSSDPISINLPPPVIVQIPVNYDYSDERFDVELQNTLRLGDNIRAVWGVGWRKDQVLSPGFLSTTEPIENRSRRAFLSTEWRAGSRWLINAGAMWENDNIVGHDVSPRIALNYHISDSQTVRTSVSRATRNPVIVEEMGDQRACIAFGCAIYNQNILASGGLSPELIREREIGYFINLRGNATVDLRVYRQELDKMIVSYWRPSIDPYTPEPDQMDFANRDHAVINGTEVQLTYKPGPRDRLVLGYAYTKIRYNGRDDISDSAPKDSGSLMLIHGFTGRLQASAAYYYVGTMAFADNHSLKPVRRLDLRLAQSFYLPHGGVSVALVAQNVLNDDLEYDPRIVPGNSYGQRYFMTLGMNFR